MKKKTNIEGYTEGKCFTKTYYDKFLNDKSEISGFINNSNLDKKIKALATKAELKVEQDGVKKLQTFDSSYFIGQSYVINDGSLNFLILQTVFIISKWQLLLQTQSLNGDPFTTTHNFSANLMLVNN